MYTRIALSLAPSVDDPDIAIELADAVCEYLTVADVASVAAAVRPDSLSDAVELLLDDEGGTDGLRRRVHHLVVEEKLNGIG